MTNELWSKEEVVILRTNYSTTPADTLLKYLPNRSYKAIEKKAESLRLKKTIRANTALIQTFFENKKFSLENNLSKNKIIKFGVCSDPHLLSKHQQLTLLRQFYAYAKKSGCTFMLNSGDISEGNGRHYPGQIQELFLHTFSEQKEYIIKNYPNDIPTYLISGDHDLDFYKLGAGDLMEEVCKEREDLSYLGQHAAYLNITPKINVYLVHPSGGSAYALSHKPQKFIESFSAPETPSIMIVGHYHRAGFFSYKGVYTFLAGCFQGQTNYMTRKALSPAIGGWIVTIHLGLNGKIAKILPEWVPFYKEINLDYKL